MQATLANMGPEDMTYTDDTESMQTLACFKLRGAIKNISMYVQLLSLYGTAELAMPVAQQQTPCQIT